MRYLIFALILIISGLSLEIKAQVSVEIHEKVALRVTPRFNPAQNFHFEDYLGERIRQVIDNSIAAQDEDALVEPFRHQDENRCWQSEFWGKWMLSATKAYEYNGNQELYHQMESSVKSLIATQSPEGYIGNYAPEHRLKAWDIWGRKYTLLGLLYFYDLSGDKKVLQAAIKLTDHLIGEVGPGKTDIVSTGFYRGMPSTSILEPVVMLYERTAEQKYLSFAKFIVDRWESEKGPKLISKALEGVPVADRFPVTESWWSWENGQKAYEMMSCYDGLLRLYRHTGENRYLEAVQAAVENIISEEINVVGSGATMECWYHGRREQTFPAAHTMETCVTITWMKLCYELFRLSGNLELVDEIEKTALNSLLGSISPDGSRFSKYGGLQGYRDLDGFQCNMPLNCCMANGPRGLVLLPDLAVMQDRQGDVLVNLYLPGRAELQLDKKTRLQLEIDTEFPTDGRISLKPVLSGSRKFKLQLRIPVWSEQNRLTVNGKAVDQEIKPGTYLVLSEDWKTGDEIVLELDMRGRVIRHREGIRTFNAVARGPMILARDSRFGGSEVDLELLPATEQYLELKPVDLENVWLGFTAEFTYGSGENPEKLELPLVNYSSAGNLWNSKNRYRVWLPQVYNPLKELPRR